MPKYITDAQAKKDYEKLVSLEAKKEAAHKRYQKALSAELKAKKVVDDALKEIKKQKEKMGERGTLYYPRKVKTTEYRYAWCNHK